MFYTYTKRKMEKKLFAFERESDLNFHCLQSRFMENLFFLTLLHSECSLSAIGLNGICIIGKKG